MDGNLVFNLLSALLAQAWLLERISRPAINKTVGTTGSGKNKIARPKRLHPPASRPQIRTLGAIIYFDVTIYSGVCFKSLNSLTKDPATGAALEPELNRHIPSLPGSATNKRDAKKHYAELLLPK